MQDARKIHQCQCPNCLEQEGHPDKVLHRQINVFLLRLNEQERRWYVALESKALGYGGDSWMSKVSGMHVETIRRGRRELDEDLEGRPVDRIRLPVGVQPTRTPKLGGRWRLDGAGMAVRAIRPSKFELSNRFWPATGLAFRA